MAVKLNIPNALTLFRILLIPFFLWRFLTARSQGEFYAAAAILAVSALSDTLDGLIARKCNMITQLGKILDPIADKLTLAAVVTALWIKRPGMWPICALFLLKESLMLLGGVLLHRRKVRLEGAKWFGKLATILFYVIMITIVSIPELKDGIILKLLLLLLVFMLFSLVQYGRIFKRMLHRPTEEL